MLKYHHRSPGLSSRRWKFTRCPERRISWTAATEAETQILGFSPLGSCYVAQQTCMRNVDFVGPRKPTKKFCFSKMFSENARKFDEKIEDERSEKESFWKIQCILGFTQRHFWSCLHPNILPSFLSSRLEIRRDICLDKKHFHQKFITAQRFPALFTFLKPEESNVTFSWQTLLFVPYRVVLRTQMSENDFALNDWLGRRTAVPQTLPTIVVGCAYLANGIWVVAPRAIRVCHDLRGEIPCKLRPPRRWHTRTLLTRGRYTHWKNITNHRTFRFSAFFSRE